MQRVAAVTAGCTYSIGAVADFVDDAEQVVAFESLVQGAQLIEDAAQRLWSEEGGGRTLVFV